MCDISSRFFSLPRGEARRAKPLAVNSDAHFFTSARGARFMKQWTTAESFRASDRPRIPLFAKRKMPKTLFLGAGRFAKKKKHGWV
jgi:hypothetical protein